MKITLNNLNSTPLFIDVCYKYLISCLNVKWRQCFVEAILVNLSKIISFQRSFGEGSSEIDHLVFRLFFCFSLFCLFISRSNRTLLDFVFSPHFGDLSLSFLLNSLHDDSRSVNFTLACSKNYLICCLETFFNLLHSLFDTDVLNSLEFGVFENSIDFYDVRHSIISKN